MGLRQGAHRNPIRGFWLACLLIAGLSTLAACDSDDPGPAATATVAPTATSAPSAPSGGTGDQPTPTPTAPGSAPTTTPSRLAPTAAAPQQAPTATPTSAPASGADLTSVWADKTLTISVGYSPGGGADAQARLLAIHLPRFLPGSPRAIVTSKPGGGTALNARDMLRRPNDGTYIGQFAQGLMVSGAMGQAEEWFMWQDYTYLGMVDGAQEETIAPVCAHTEKMKNLDDFLNGGPWRWGDISPDTTGGVTLKWFTLINIPVDIYFGYGGSAEVAAAFDRGEMDMTTRCNPTYAKQYADWFTSGDVIPLFAWGNLDPDIQVPPDQPLADGIRAGRWPWFGKIHETLAGRATADQFAAFDAFTALGGTHVWALPPGVPEEVGQALQKAFLDTVNSPGYIEDMRIRERVVAPLSAEETALRIQTLQDLTPAAKAVLEAMTGG